jgi:hypothetical protein
MKEIRSRGGTNYRGETQENSSYDSTKNLYELY